MNWNRAVAVRIVAVGVGLVIVAVYMRFMLDVTAQPVIPFQPPTTIPTLPIATLTVLQRTTPRGALDFPDDGASIVNQTQVRGWAIDAASTDGPGVDRVRLFLDGNYLMDATYGQDRPDVGSSFGDRFNAAGWVAQLDLSQAADGPHRLEARAHSSFSDRDTNYSIHIMVAPMPSQPRGAVDAPSDQQAVEGVIQVSGWALDETAASGTGVDRVDVYLDNAQVATAQYGLPRPDVASGYGAHFQNAGWQARVNLSEVGAGAHQLEARAHSTVQGGDTTNYSVTVEVNPPGG
jgi:hypothetical protein